MVNAVAAPVCLLLTDDLPVIRRLRKLAADHGLTIADAEPAEGAGEPAVAVIDLHLPGALERVREWRARWPAALLAGYLGEPDRDRWVAAQRAGCDLVSNRGALVLRLRGLLAHSVPAGRAFPLFDAADAAGRLGLVFRAADTPVGPVAVYRVAGGLYAIADRCPHAGAALSGGETDGSVLTCPGHGSRFDICTGERLRGPADTDIAVFPLADMGGQLCLLVRT
jgi:nitrite reductase/ring-hydroxylating ferredoxin subunit